MSRGTGGDGGRAVRPAARRDGGGVRGRGNAGRPMLLEGGLKWQAMSLSPADMDFVGMKAAAAREIALAFGVPPMLLGLPGDATYANYKRGQPGAVAADGTAAGRDDRSGDGAGAARVVPGGAAGGGPGPGHRAAEDRERLWRQVIGGGFPEPEEKRAMLGLVDELAVTAEARIRVAQRGVGGGRGAQAASNVSRTPSGNAARAN